VGSRWQERGGEERRGVLTAESQRRGERRRGGFYNWERRGFTTEHTESTEGEERGGVRYEGSKGGAHSTPRRSGRK